MKISPPQLLLGCCCAFILLIGCGPMAGPGRFPNGYAGQPFGFFNPRAFPGGLPWYNVGYPGMPGGPGGTPIVWNPAPYPGTTPYPPGIPVPDPGTTPTIPVTNPNPAPTEPDEDPTEFWSPWPLPPRGGSLAVRAVGYSRTNVDKTRDSQSRRQRGAFVQASQKGYRRQQLQDGATASPSDDLKYRGGKIIRDLFYVNLYVSGDTDWSATDVELIDGSLAAAMRDEHLNNVLLQYYDNQSIRSTPLPSHPLVGYTPTTVTRGDIQNFASYLYQKGLLDSYDLENTVFNFVLPPGTLLTTDAQAANSSQASTASRSRTYDTGSELDEVDSRSGMGGYHGSVEIANGSKVYFAVSVYSERFSNGVTNGIPVFSEPWKNVTATHYHQLIEARTNPDVEDALRYSSDLNADRNLGWVSDTGLEIGDIPIRANVPLTSVITEVPLADGRGLVPVQLPYSNYVHGPEGPIAQPHPLP